MMTRVVKNRFNLGVMLLAVLLLVGVTSMPAFAREDISAGQTGDPTDGNGITSTSGASTSDQGQSNTTNTTIRTTIQTIPARHMPELVLFVGGSVYHIDLQVLLLKWGVK